jgi:hypothetical protein
MQFHNPAIEPHHKQPSRHSFITKEQGFDGSTRWRIAGPRVLPELVAAHGSFQSGSRLAKKWRETAGNGIYAIAQ